MVLLLSISGQHIVNKRGGSIKGIHFFKWQVIANATFQTDQQISVAVQFLTQSISGNRLVCGNALC